ncbi:M16 family metallopeptidase [Adhaeribacter aquaticus]|uniref:M16 family metallopeptidase n=1 Tax=Adhaeribacter aquaticus TaxID=299567 RepID=UPI000418A38D|nr:pitrilysin family protein [Adhaeribacter aquaticus]
MKQFFLILVFYLAALSLFAQQETTSFTVNGLKVIFQPTQKETISMNMFYRGGVTNLKPGQAGLENLALYAATRCGTQKYPEEVFRDMADEFGIRIAGGSALDYGSIKVNCVKDFFGQGWSLFSSAILNPTFDARQLIIEKERMIASIRNQVADPEERLEQLALQAAFANTPYAIDPLGSEQTLQKFTSDSLKQYYYQNLLNKNRMFLVIAGNLKKEELEQKIKESFANLPVLPYKPYVYKSPVFQDQQLVTEHRELATNYFCGVFNAPSMNHPDFPAYLLSINALSGRIFNEVRNRQNLSYEAGADVKVHQMAYSTIYASTSNPKPTLLAMATEVGRMKKNEISQELLDLLKKSVKRSYYRRQESASRLVEYLGEAEIMGGWELADTLLEKIDKVSTKEMFDVYQKYSNGIRWAFLGNKQLAQEAFY